MKPKTAILYARVSSASQAEEEVSIPAQLDSGRRRAVKDEATILREFVDEGRSAYIESNRREFEAAIDYAVTHQVDIFYTWSSSRFARNKFEAVKYKRELERGGVRLVYLSMSVDLSTDEGWLLDSMFEMMDEQRSRDTSKDTRRSLIHNAQQGYWVSGLAPFGYVSQPAPDNPRRRKLVPNEAEAALAREVFQLRATGIGAKAIADRFNAKGIRYRNRPWTKACVLQLLRNRAMLGHSIFNKAEPRTKRPRPESEWLVLQTHEAIIDADLWQAAQEQMDTAAAPYVGKGRTRSSHLFTGLMRCGRCGGAMTIENARGRNEQYTYYSCHAAKNKGGCEVERYAADKIDAQLNEFILQRLLTPDTLRAFVAEMARISKQSDETLTRRLQAISAQVATIKAKNSRLYEILELHGKDAPDLADLTARLRENNAELKALEVAAITAEAEIDEPVDMARVDFAAITEELRAMLLEGTEPNRLRSFYATFIQGITVTGLEARIQYDPAKLIAAASPAVHSLQNWGRSPSMTRTEVIVLAQGSRRRRSAGRRISRLAG